MSILIDGFNLLHQVPRLRSLLKSGGPRPACRALIALLCRWVERVPGASVVLVLDGARPPGQSIKPPAAGLEVRYSDRQADQDLASLLERRGRHTLVSDDGELVSCARRWGQEVCSPRRFFQELEEDLEQARDDALRAPDASPAGVAAWVEAFSDRPSKAPPPPGAAPRAGEGLSPEEVKAWLEYFGEAPASE